MREWKRCYNGSWNSTLTMWNVHLLAGNIKCERMFFRNLPMISTCFSNFCLLSPLLLWCDCCLPLLSGVPFLPAQPWGSVFSLVILPMLLKPLRPHRAHIKHTLFILLGQSAAFHIPPYVLPPNTCSLLSVTLLLSSLSSALQQRLLEDLSLMLWEAAGKVPGVLIPFSFSSTAWLQKILPAKPQVTTAFMCTLQHPSPSVIPSLQMKALASLSGTVSVSILAQLLSSFFLTTAGITTVLLWLRVIATVWISSRPLQLSLCPKGVYISQADLEWKL